MNKLIIIALILALAGCASANYQIRQPQKLEETLHQHGWTKLPNTPDVIQVAQELATGISKTINDPQQNLVVLTKQLPVGQTLTSEDAEAFEDVIGPQLGHGWVLKFKKELSSTDMEYVLVLLFFIKEDALVKTSKI